ncbi:MAG: hypothetical protein LBP87_01900 [Planctomycetaceae bacterium]|jgi:hypothetical protein|nr:hypothetical protein [Planctomycetaceae bacterium]
MRNVVLLITSFVLIILCVWISSGPCLPKTEVDFRFKSADQNHDDKLSRKEFEEYIIRFKMFRPIDIISKNSSIPVDQPIIVQEKTLKKTTQVSCCCGRNCPCCDACMKGGECKCNTCNCCPCCPGR